MKHRVTRNHKRLGWPEVWLACTVLLAIAPATIWWGRHFAPEWKQTAGHITSSEVSRTHYNAQDYRAKANVSYEYSVGMAKYVGRFEGFWPEVGSPNALAPSEIETLNQPKKDVIVFYDPSRVERSTLHPNSGDTSPFWIVLTAAGLCIAAAYTFLVYPAWRA